MITALRVEYVYNIWSWSRILFSFLKCRVKKLWNSEKKMVLRKSPMVESRSIIRGVVLTLFGHISFVLIDLVCNWYWWPEPRKKREKRILSFWLKKIVFDLVINHYLARLFFDYFNTFCFTSDDVDLKSYVCCTLFGVIVFIAALWSALCCMQCHHYELKVYNNMLLNKWRLCWNHGCHLSVTPSCI